MSPATAQKTREIIIKRPKIVFYNLNIKKDNEKYRYYSVIVPVTLAKNIASSKSYQVSNIGEIKDFRKLLLTRDQKKKYVDTLVALGRENSADYVITGECEIKDDALFINLNVLSVKHKRLEYISKRSLEIGAILKDTVDDVAVKVEKSIKAFQNIKLIAKVKAVKKTQSESPFMPLYNSLNFISFGIGSGKAFLLNKWEEAYNDARFVHTYIMFHVTGYLGFSANVDYLATDNENKTPGISRLTIWGGTLDINYFLKFTKYFSFGLSAGVGTAITRIKVISPASGDGPFEIPLTDDEVKSLYMKGSASLNFHLKPLNIRFGSSYKRINHSTDIIDMYTIFAGVGYNI